MNFLLDTHALLWFFNGNKELSHKAKSVIEDTGNTKYVSIASLLEISIKVSLKKLKIEKGYKNIALLIDENGFQILPLSFDHTIELSRLPFHHRDPFDRMLVSQAIAENMAIITKDSFIKDYNVKIVW